MSRGIWSVRSWRNLRQAARKLRARIAERMSRRTGKKRRGSCAKMPETRILFVSHDPFRVAGQSDHVFRSRIRIKRILIFAVVQGRRICIREIPAVRAYGNLRRAQEISRWERTLDCFFPRFPLVTDAVGRSEKKIRPFFATNTSYFFLFLRTVSLSRFVDRNRIVSQI